MYKFQIIIKAIAAYISIVLFAKLELQTQWVKQKEKKSIKKAILRWNLDLITYALSNKNIKQKAQYMHRSSSTREILMV